MCCNCTFSVNKHTPKMSIVVFYSTGYLVIKINRCLFGASEPRNSLDVGLHVSAAAAVAVDLLYR